jgi:hypothetical protein
MSNRIKTQEAKSAPNGAQSNRISQAKASEVPPSAPNVLPEQSRALRLLCGEEAAKEIEALAEKYGVSIAVQLAGAVGTWLDFVHREQEQYPEARGWQPSKIAEAMVEYGNLLNYERHDRVRFFAQRRREEFVGDSGRILYAFLLEHLERLPLRKAATFAEGMAELLDGHVGFADEVRYLKELACNSQDVFASPLIDTAAA